MNLDEKENYRQDDQYFQDDETRYDEKYQYDDIDIDAPPKDHSISDNAEPDYGNDFAEEEINHQKLNNPNGDEFDQEFDNDDEDDDLEDDDLEDDDLEEDDLEDDDLDEEDYEDDEEGTDPNRNL